MNPASFYFAAAVLLALAVSLWPEKSDGEGKHQGRQLDGSE